MIMSSMLSSGSGLKPSRLAVMLAPIVSIFAPQVFLVQASSVLVPPHAPGAVTASQFDGMNDYVTFGVVPSLGATPFTIETWFRRDGTNTTTSTGITTDFAIAINRARGRGRSRRAVMA
jgi:hypothetical protein